MWLFLFHPHRFQIYTLVITFLRAGGQRPRRPEFQKTWLLLGLLLLVVPVDAAITCVKAGSNPGISQGKAMKLIGPKGGNKSCRFCDFTAPRMFFWAMNWHLRHLRAFRQIKRWIEYVAICCCTCALLVRFWALAWGFSFDDDHWHYWNSQCCSDSTPVGRDYVEHIEGFAPAR